MNVPPPKGTGSPPSTPGSSGPDSSNEPKKGFPKDLDKDKIKEKEGGKKSSLFEQLAEEKKEKKADAGAFGAVQGQGEQSQHVGGQQEKVSATSGVDQITSIIKADPGFGKAVTKVETSQLDNNQTRIGLTLDNGVRINVDMAAGGQELNITVEGLTAEMQQRADASKLALTQKLEAQGFTIHNFETTVASQGVAAAPPPGAMAPGPAGAAPGSEAQEGGREGGEGGEGGGEEEGEPR